MEKVLELRRVAESTTDENLGSSAATNLSIIEAMCEYKDALETSNSSEFPPRNPNVANYTYLMKFLEENTISCSQMFPACVYMGMDQENCSEMIQPVDTIHGRCCRVRMVPFQLNPSYDEMANISAEPNPMLYSNSTDNPNNEEAENSSLFSGAKFNSSLFVIEGAALSEDFSAFTQPFHFSVLLNLNQDPYLCDNSTTSTNQILFSLSSPGKFLQIQDFSPLPAANEEVVLTLLPEAVLPTSPEEVMNNENKECVPYWSWKGKDYYTTKAGHMDACSLEFVSSNCKCSLFGDRYEFFGPLETSTTCKTGSNSNDTICLKKMDELARKWKHICLCTGTDCPAYYCSGTVYSYITTNQPMKNAAKLWASLKKFGNDTTLDIPWANNKTGIIHFTLDTSGQTKSTNNDSERFFAIFFITVISSLIFLLIIVFPHFWRCICGMIVKCTLYFRGVLHTRKISALNINDKP